MREFPGGRVVRHLDQPADKFGRQGRAGGKADQDGVHALTPAAVSIDSASEFERTRDQAYGRRARR